MIVKAMELEIKIPHANSLKDKRKLLKSLIHRTRQKFNVSISELDYLDEARASILGLVIVTNNQAYGDKVLDQCLNFIETEYDLDVINIIKELR